MGDGTLLKLFEVIVACGVILVNSSGFSAAQTLREDLQKLEGLRDGLNTPLDLVDKTGAEILNKYSTPTDRGQIYYQLAFIYGQSGLRRPEKLIEYTKKAMDLPLEEDKRLRLFVYWGDAQRFADPKSPPVERRKKAATVYLEGLRETQELNIPAKAPRVPIGMMGDVSGNPKMVAAWKKRQQEAADAQRKAIVEIELVKIRDVLMNQVVDIYTSPPFATDEMIEIASKKQLKPAVIDALVERVNTAIAAMPKPDPVEPIAQPVRHNGLFFLWASVAVSLFVFAVAVLALRVRKRAHKRNSL